MSISRAEISFLPREATVGPSLMSLDPCDLVIGRCAIVIVRCAIIIAGREISLVCSLSAQSRRVSTAGSRTGIPRRRASVMGSRDDLIVHFVRAIVCRDWCVDGSRDLHLRGDTFPDGLVGSPDPRGETFRRFDPDFRSRDDSSRTGD
jgi:hypothetical protein